MVDKQTEFATFVFQEIYGKLTDEDGQPYVQVYQFEIEELIKDMLFDLNTILSVFGGIYSDDVSKLFAIHFWDTDAIANIDVDHIAFKFDELYGDSIGDKPTVGLRR
jgi:hypothetical protein